MSLHDTILAHLPWGAPMRRASTIHGLGVPLEATRRDRLMVAGLLAFAGATAVVGVIGTVRAAMDSGGVVQLLAIPLFFFGVAAFVVVVTLRRARDFVGVYEHGVAIDSGGRLRLVSWQEIAVFHEETADLVDGMTRTAHDTYRLQLHDGSIFSWNWEFERHRHVGLCCAARLDRCIGCCEDTADEDAASCG